MPDGTEGKNGGVLLLLAEDSLKKTVLQRLQAANADLRRISVPNRPVLIPRDLSLIEEIACQIQASLIVIDPIMAFLGVDANGDQKVRGALTPLKSFAEKTGVAVVLAQSPNQERRGTRPPSRYRQYRDHRSYAVGSACRQIARRA